MKKNEHPLSFADFEVIYLCHLSADDRPTCFIAYCRAEADVINRYGDRKLKSYNTFRTMLCRSRGRRKKKKIENGTCKV